MTQNQQLKLTPDVMDTLHDLQRRGNRASLMLFGENLDGLDNQTRKAFHHWFIPLHSLSGAEFHAVSARMAGVVVDKNDRGRLAWLIDQERGSMPEIMRHLRDSVTGISHINNALNEYNKQNKEQKFSGYLEEANGILSDVVKVLAELGEMPEMPGYIMKRCNEIYRELFSLVAPYITNQRSENIVQLAEKIQNAAVPFIQLDQHKEIKETNTISGLFKSVKRSLIQSDQPEEIKEPNIKEPHIILDSLENMKLLLNEFVQAIAPDQSCHAAVERLKNQTFSMVEEVAKTLATIYLGNKLIDESTLENERDQGRAVA